MTACAASLAALAASLAAHASAAESEKAKKALATAKQLRDCMKAADRALSAFAAHMVEAHQLVLELRDQGGPGYLPAMNALKRAHIAGIMGTPLQEQHLGPNERVSLTDLADRWGSAVVVASERKLAEPAKTVRAA